MVTAEVLVTGGNPVLPPHLRQPLPQPCRVMQWEPGGGGGLRGHCAGEMSLPSPSS